MSPMPMGLLFSFFIIENQILASPSKLAILDILRNNQRNPVLRYQLNQKEEKFILNQKNSKKVFNVKVDVDKSKEQIKSAVGDLVNAPSLYLSDR
jgi:hypothetical protein